MVAVVHAESQGRQFPEIVQAHGILGHRAMTRSEMSVSVLQGQLAQLILHLRRDDLPTPARATTRRWAAKTPSLPELLLRDGRVSIQDLQPWARRLVADGSLEADLPQEPSVEASSGARSDWISALVALGVLWAWGNGRRASNGMVPQEWSGPAPLSLTLIRSTGGDQAAPAALNPLAYT